MAELEQESAHALLDLEERESADTVADFEEESADAVEIRRSSCRERLSLYG